MTSRQIYSPHLQQDRIRMPWTAVPLTTLSKELVKVAIMAPHTSVLCLITPLRPPNFRYPRQAFRSTVYLSVPVKVLAINSRSQI